MESNEPKYKPRRTRGTPSYYYRNLFGCGAIGVGVVALLLWELTPAAKRIRKNILAGKYTDSPEAVERRKLINASIYNLEPIPKTKEDLLIGLANDDDWTHLPIYTKDDGR